MLASVAQRTKFDSSKRKNDMINQHNNFLFKWAVFTLIFILTVTGCGAGNVIVPTPSLIPEASPSPQAVDATSTSEPVSQENVLYQDDFTNPATSWPDRKFDNYFIGYHEPEYYHVELTGSNYKTTVFEPEKRSFDDATIEMKVFAVAAKTAAEGDFRYGLAFRRSGDQYYAFTISPRSKKWFVLKSSPSGLTVLAEGTDDNLHDLDSDDTLRVDAQGPNFLFHLNDQLIGQASDPDYASGEIGFYVESFDSPNTHIHFDKFTIQDLTLSLVCSVNEGTLYVRSGPGKTYSQTAILSNGDTVKALGISPNKWIKIVLESGDQGWVSYSEGLISCTPTVDLFPIVSQ